MIKHHTQQTSHEPTRTSRRRFLQRSALSGFGLAVFAACGGKSTTSEADATQPADAASSESTAVAPSPAPTAAPVEATGAVDPAAPTVSAASAETNDAAVDPSAGGSFAGTSEVAVSFTYVASGGGRVNNPYIAVWVETPDGQPVRTLEVAYQQGRKGKKWLNDLKRWFGADQARISAGGAEIIDTISAPTRLPGTTDLVWDGTNDAGEPMPIGAYVLIIEAARERGPYDMITQELTVTGEPDEVVPANAGDLQQVTIRVRPRS
jgi:hypothetical protein